MSATSPVGALPNAGSAPIHVVAKKRTLPGSRALVGALLIGIAGFGTYALSTGVFGSDSRTVVVASHDLIPGTKITASDVKVVQADIASEFASHTVASPSVVLGTTVLGPVKAGEILQPGSLVAASPVVGPQISFAIPASRAVSGSLQSGEAVDVLVSDKASDDAPARTAVSNAKVIKSSQATSSLGTKGDLTITLGLANREEAAAVAAAVDSGQVTLIRTTGIAAATPSTTVAPAQ